MKKFFSLVSILCLISLGQSYASQGMDAIKKAQDEEKYIFFLFYNTQDGATEEMGTNFDSAKNDAGERANFLRIDISDEGEWVKQLDSKIDAYWALKKLPPRQREVIQHRIDGYEYEEIAEKMGITVGTVNQYIAKASKKLCGIV